MFWLESHFDLWAIQTDIRKSKIASSQAIMVGSWGRTVLKQPWEQLDEAFVKTSAK